MIRKLLVNAVVTSVMIFGLIAAADNKDKNAKDEKGEHKTAHGGCLNAIGTCENGHAEVKIQDGVLKLWLVGGGSDTVKAVRITDKEINLSITIDGEKDQKTLLLKAKPNVLAEEKEGDCSSFEGKADWLKGIKKFVATATINFKGKKQELKIEYPAGYDPDDE